MRIIQATLENLGYGAAANRLLAAGLFLQGIDSGSEERLVAVASALADGPVLAEFLRALGAAEARPHASAASAPCGPKAPTRPGPDTPVPAARCS